MKSIMTNSVQQYSKKVSLLSQQTGKVNGKKFNADKVIHERKAKSTSIGKRPKTSSMNKHKKRTLKKYNGQGR
jgi:hypothetical protein